VTENNRSYGIRERIKIQVWKRYRITRVRLYLSSNFRKELETKVVMETKTEQLDGKVKKKNQNGCNRKIPKIPENSKAALYKFPML